MEVNLSTPLRNEIAKWINSKNKSLDSGLELLRKSGYKPHVYRNFYQNRGRHDIPKKLESELRLFLRFHANPNNPIHQDAVLEFHQKNVETDNNQLGLQPLNDDLYPVLVKNCIVQFRDLYTKRSIMHNKLKKMADDSSPKANEQRADILAKIEAASHRMDELWQAVDQWKSFAYLPPEKLLEDVLDLDKVKAPQKAPLPPKPVFEVSNDLTVLNKQCEAWRIKITKAKNRLNYQSDTRKPILNPMLPGPKRIKQEKRIKRLMDEKLIIETAIANLM